MKKGFKKVLAVALSVTLVLSVALFQSFLATAAPDFSDPSLIDFSNTEVIGAELTANNMGDSYYSVTKDDESNASLAGDYDFNFQAGSNAAGTYAVEKPLADVKLPAYTADVIGHLGTYDYDKTLGGFAFGQESGSSIKYIDTPVGNFSGFVMQSANGELNDASGTDAGKGANGFRVFNFDAVKFTNSDSFMFYVDHSGSTQPVEMSVSLRITVGTNPNNTQYITHINSPYYLLNNTTGEWTGDTILQVSGGTTGIGRVTIPANFTGWLRIPATSFQKNAGGDTFTAEGHEVSGLRFYPNKLGGEYGTLRVGVLSCVAENDGRLYFKAGQKKAVALGNFDAAVINAEKIKASLPAYTAGTVKSFSLNTAPNNGSFTWLTSGGNAVRSIDTPIGTVAAFGMTSASGEAYLRLNNDERNGGSNYNFRINGFDSSLQFVAGDSYMFYIKQSGATVPFRAQLSIFGSHIVSGATHNGQMLLIRNAEYQLLDVNTGIWTKHITPANNAVSGSKLGYVEVPANFEGWVKVPLSSFQRNDGGGFATASTVDGIRFYPIGLGGKYGTVVVGGFSSIKGTADNLVIDNGIKNFLYNYTDGSATGALNLSKGTVKDTSGYTCGTDSSNRATTVMALTLASAGANLCPWYAWGTDPYSGEQITSIDTPIGRVPGFEIVSADGTEIFYENNVRNNHPIINGTGYQAWVVVTNGNTCRVKDNGSVMFYVEHKDSTAAVKLGVDFQANNRDRVFLGAAQTYNIFDLATGKWETKTTTTAKGIYGQVEIPAGFAGWIRISTNAFTKDTSSHTTVAMNDQNLNNFSFRPDGIGGKYGSLTIGAFTTAPEDANYLYVANNHTSKIYTNVLDKSYVTLPSYDVTIAGEGDKRSFAADSNAIGYGETAIKLAESAVVSAGKSFMFYADNAGSAVAKLRIDLGNSGMYVKDNAELFAYDNATKMWSTVAADTDSIISISSGFSGWIAIPYEAMVDETGAAANTAQVAVDDINVLPMNIDTNVSIGSFIVLDMADASNGSVINSYDGANGISFTNSDGNVYKDGVLFGANVQYDSAVKAMEFTDTTGYLNIYDSSNTGNGFIPAVGRLYKLTLRFSNCENETAFVIKGYKGEQETEIQRILVPSKADWDERTVYFTVDETYDSAALGLVEGSKYKPDGDVSTYISNIKIYEVGAAETVTDADGATFIPLGSDSWHIRTWERTESTTKVTFTVDATNVDSDMTLTLTTIDQDADVKLKNVSFAEENIVKVFNIKANSGIVSYEYTMDTPKGVAVLRLDGAEGISTDIIKNFNAVDIWYSETARNNACDVNIDNTVDIRDLLNQKKKLANPGAYSLSGKFAERLSSDVRATLIG